MGQVESNWTNRVGKHAVVIGASVAGLLAARVLSEHFDHVTLIERDVLPDEVRSRKGIPQAQHAHAILAKGMEAMSALFPGLIEELEKDGAVVMDFASTVRWFHFGSYKAAFQGNVSAIGESRPLLDSKLRARVAAIPNVKIRQACAINGLATSPDHARVTGVILQAVAPGEKDLVLNAGLVVDASGRGSRTPQWLASLGYERPTESEVRINVGYTSRVYRRKPGDVVAGSGVQYILPAAPAEKRGGVAIPIEGDRWLVTLFGYHHDHAPTDDLGFREFARSLASPDIYNLITQAEPLSEAVVHKVPSSLRRHYEKMDRFPEGCLVVGDAVCSFNPIFGQGMTVASREAIALLAVLKGRRSLKGLAHAFYRKAIPTLDTAWMLATGEDFRYPETEGDRPLYTNLLNKYVLAVHHASARDTRVYGAFIDVMNMLKPPTVLFTPAIVWRVIRANRSAMVQRSRNPQPYIATKPAR